MVIGSPIKKPGIIDECGEPGSRLASLLYYAEIVIGFVHGRGDPGGRPGSQTILIFGGEI